MENSSSNSNIQVRKRGGNKQRQNKFQYFSPALCVAEDDAGSTASNAKDSKIMKRSGLQSFSECEHFCTRLCTGFQFDAKNGECILFSEEIELDNIIRVGQQDTNSKESSHEEVTCAIILKSNTNEVPIEAKEVTDQDILLSLSLDLAGPFCDDASTQEYKDQILESIKSVLNSKVVQKFQEEVVTSLSLSIIGDFCTSPDEGINEEYLMAESEHVAGDVESVSDTSKEDSSGDEKFLKLKLDVVLHDEYGKEVSADITTTFIASELNSHEFHADLSSQGLNGLSFTNLARMKRNRKSRKPLASSATPTVTVSTPMRMKQKVNKRSPSRSSTRSPTNPLKDDSSSISLDPNIMSWREDAFRIFSNVQSEDGKNMYCLKATSTEVGSSFDVEDCDSISDNLQWFYLDPEDGRLRLNLQPELCMSWRKKNLFLKSCPKGYDTKNSQFFMESGMIKQLIKKSKSEKNKAKVVAVTTSSKYGRKIELVYESNDDIDENNKLWTLELASHHPSVAPSSEPNVAPSREPSTVPSMQPSKVPSESPSTDSSSEPSFEPSDCVDEEGWVVGGIPGVDKFAGLTCNQLDTSNADSWCDAVMAQSNSTYLGKSVEEACCACHGSTFKTTYPSLTPSNKPSISDLPTVVPIPSSQPTDCVDEPGFRFYDNEHLILTCSDLDVNPAIPENMCERFEGIDFNGKTVQSACCICGGGQHHSREPSFVPSVSQQPSLFPSTSVAPSLHPSSVPSASPSISSAPSNMPSGKDPTIYDGKPCRFDRECLSSSCTTEGICKNGVSTLFSM